MKKLTYRRIHICSQATAGEINVIESKSGKSSFSACVGYRFLIPFIVSVFSAGIAAVLIIIYCMITSKDPTLFTLIVCSAIPLYLSVRSIYRYITYNPFQGYEPPFIIFKDYVLESSNTGVGWYHIGKVMAQIDFTPNNVGVVLQLSQCSQLKGLGHIVLPSGSLTKNYAGKEYYFVYIPSKQQITLAFETSSWELEQDVKQYYREIEDIQFPNMQGDYKIWESPHRFD